MNDAKTESISVDQSLKELTKPVGFNREKFVVPVREELGKKQYNAEVIAGELSDAVTEVRELSQELVLAKKTELIPDGKEATDLFNDGGFREYREKTVHQAESIMGRPIFGKDGYLTPDYLTDQSGWQSLLVKEAYEDERGKQDLKRSWGERLDQIPEETRKQLVELYKLVFADGVVHATDGSLKDAGITPASSSLGRVSEYLAEAPVSRKLSFELMNEFCIVADGGLSAVARGHFPQK